MKDKTMMLSVIICTYNRDKYIYNVMKSIVDGSLSADKYEILAIDNNSTDGTKSEILRFMEDNPDVNVRYLFEPEQGLSCARNRGIEESSGDVLVYVDDDAKVNENYLKTYFDFFEANPDCKAAGGPIIPEYEGYEEPEWMTYHLKRLLTAYLYFGDRQTEFPGKNYPGGGNAAYRKELFDLVGKYNTSLGRTGSSLAGGEEKDIFRKMDSIGIKYYYLPESILYHIIPERKMSDEYFNNLTSGIGRSERIRTRSISKGAYLKRVFSEMVKWCGTIVLSLWYLIKGKPGSSKKLLRFRSNVSKELLSLNKK